MKKLIILIFTIISLNATAQTFELFDINPAGNSEPSGFIEYNGKLYFSARDGSNGRELWVSDGTQAGTQLFIDIHTTSSSDPYGLKVFNGKLYFFASDDMNIEELWVTDGTVNGTQRLTTTIDVPYGLTEYNNKLYFSAYGSAGNEIWVTDGTASGTTMLKNINANSSSSPRDFMVFNGKLFFIANDGINGNEWWSTDGTTQGTTLLVALNPTNATYTTSPMIYNGLFYFTTDNGTDGAELWRSDGTASGTQMFMDINPNGSSAPSYFVLYNGKLLFTADDGTNGRELWMTDGTTSGTSLVKDICSSCNGDARYFTEYKGNLYFRANSGTTRKLYFTNGTNSGTGVVPGLVNGTDPRNLVVYNDRLYYNADYVPNDRQLFQHTNTNGLYNTSKIAPTVAPNTNPIKSFSYVPFEYNGSLFFEANYTSAGSELWKLTTAAPTSTSDIVDANTIQIYPNPTNDYLQIETKEKIESVIVTEISGRQLMQIENVQKQIDLGQLSAGIYFIRVKTTKGTKTKKIQKL